MDHEQQRVWSDERASRNLQRGHDRFAGTGLMNRLDEPRLLVTVLLPDPLAPSLGFDDDVLKLIPERFEGRTANGVQLLGETVVTDEALGRFALGEGGMQAYTVIRRAGAVEVGVGSTTRYQLRGDSDGSPFVYRLHQIVHAVRVVIETQAQVLLRPELAEQRAGPFELDVALPETEGAFLGGRADGWRDPKEPSWGQPRCGTEDVLVRTQFDEWPETSDAQNVAIVNVADRVCNAFGTTQRFFAPPNGHQGAGQLSPEYA